MQMGSDNPSDWIQDPSAWSHGRIEHSGDMQVKLQVGSDHPSDWIQDPSAWSHGRIVDPTIRVIGCNRKLNQASY